LLVLRSSDVVEALSPELAVQAAREAFTGLSLGRISQPRRTVMTVRGNWWGVMQSASDEAFVVKAVNVIPDNASRGRPVVNAAVILMDPATGEPLALIDGQALTAIRTAAASVLSTEVAYGRSVGTLGMIGAGYEARFHLRLAMSYLRVNRVLITARRSHVALARELGAEAVDLERLLRDSDVIFAATTSREPVVLGRHLRDDFHVASVGAHTPDSRELDDDAVARARTYIVDSLEGISQESGDYIGPASRGLLSGRRVIEIGDVLARGLRVERPSIFKSVGTSAQDNVAAYYAYREALRRGLGLQLEFP